MFCNACGKSITDDAQYCNYCGAGVGTPLSAKRLVRLRSNRKVAGVCSGLGKYLGLDPIVVRLVWVFLTFVSGLLPGIVVYVLAWIIVPEEPAGHAVVSSTQPATPVPSGT
jgi:phage shock protein C